jgi:hypothetical protein
LTVIYGSNVADVTLTTACQMATTTGGTETSNTTTIASTSNPYAEIRSKGGASTAVASLPTPTGNGWIYWPGQAGTFAAGNWSAIHTHSAVSHGVNSVIRFYKYSAGVFTSIGSITGPTQTVTTKTSYTHAATAMSAVTLAATDGIYVDLWWFDNNANSGGDNPTNFISNSATAGVASDMQVTTSTFTPSGTTSSRTVPASAALASFGLSRIVPATASLQATNSRIVPASAALSRLGLFRVVPVTASLANNFSRIVPATASLSQPSSRTVPASAALASFGLSRIVPATASLVRTLSRTVPTSAALSFNASRVVPATASLTIEIASGGFGLFANTASGTVTFDQVRFTQYPDPALSLSRVLDRLGTSNAAWNQVTLTNTTVGVKTSTDGINFTTATSGSPIPGLTGQADPVIDLFNLNSLANYISTSKSGGSAATPTYDTANSRITLTGGSGALYLNSATADDDIDLLCVMDRSDAGGLMWRYIDGNNFYELAAYDDSASGGFTNQLRLYKVVSGVRSLLGSASLITWPRSTPGTSPYKCIRVTMLSNVITVYFEGATMQTYTDGSPLGIGKCGLRNDGGTSRYYQLRIQTQGDYVSGTPKGDIVTGKFVYTQSTLNTTDPSVTPQLLDLTTSARSPNIATGALIPQLHDPSKPFAEFFNVEMHSLAQSSGDYFWNMDRNSALTFKARAGTPAPFCLYSTDLLFLPQVTPLNAADLYRNQQIITNTVGITDTQHEEKIADGSASSWSMKYPLYSAPTITVGGISKTVGVQGVDTGKDFYWQKGSVSIGQDASADTITSGYILEFDYVGQFPDQVTRNNLPEQAARASVEGGSGIVCAIEDGKGMLSSNAIVKADGLLARHANNDTVQITVTTEVKLGLQSGMIVPVFLPEHHLNNRQLLVTKVSRSGYMSTAGITVYRDTITATDGPSLNNWGDVLGL